MTGRAEPLPPSLPAQLRPTAEGLWVCTRPSSVHTPAPLGLAGGACHILEEESRERPVRHRVLGTQRVAWEPT